LNILDYHDKLNHIFDLHKGNKHRSASWETSSTVTSPLKIAPEAEHSDDTGGHHFGIAHLALPIFGMVKCFQKIVTF